ncbi:MAG: hypothetical protein IJ673_06260, partial [Treponema sp.]|nr:hypothetical protein [Treponema sp.]
HLCESFGSVFSPSLWNFSSMENPRSDTYKKKAKTSESHYQISKARFSWNQGTAFFYGVAYEND